MAITATLKKAPVKLAIKDAKGTPNATSSASYHCSALFL